MKDLLFHHDVCLNQVLPKNRLCRCENLVLVGFQAEWKVLYGGERFGEPIPIAVGIAQKMIGPFRREVFKSLTKELRPCERDPVEYRLREVSGKIIVGLAL